MTRAHQRRTDVPPSEHEPHGPPRAVLLVSALLLAGPAQGFPPADPPNPVEVNDSGLDPVALQRGAGLLLLDHFLTYGVRITKKTTAFPPRGPVTLTDVFGANDYDIKAPAALALPAEVNLDFRSDEDTHLLEYPVKPAKGAPRFAGVRDVHVANQCNDVYLTVRKPVSLLVPTAKDLDAAVAVPIEADHEVDHYLCYQATVAAKLTNGTKLPKPPRALQVDALDQFQERRYDLGAVTKLCVPVETAGAPAFLKGDAKGSLAPFEPAVRRHEEALLLCYQAKPARVEIPQDGCGPLDPLVKGTKIEPPQSKHTPNLGMFVANQLGPLRLDSVKEREICLPTETAPDPTLIPETNCLDGLDNNGNGLADCQDPTCLGSQVQCVPAVGAGAELGILQANGPCPVGYSQLLNRFQGLQGQPCVGCTCATACSVTVRAFATAGCGGASVQATFTTTSESFECRSVTSGTKNFSNKSSTSKVCQPGGTATQAPPTFASSQVFCVAQSSQTCAAAQVCVPATTPAKTCADIDASFSCPAGYSGTVSDFFTGFMPGSCGACSSCTSGSSLTCLSVSTAGLACGGAADVVDTTCGTIGPSRNPVAGLANQFIRNGTDNCSITPTNNPPQPTGGRRVCCLP